MVAISLYRGNLHKVPEVPRRWLAPNPKITLKDFRSLLHRRSRCLTRLRASTSAAAAAAASNSKPREEAAGDNGRRRFESDSFPRSEPSHVGVERGADDTRADVAAEAMNRDGLGDEPIPWSEVKPLVLNKDGRGNPPHEMTGVSGNPNSEANLTSNNVCVLGEDKRRKEVEEKLQFLNGKKHNLVQLLKQILNAEEELKRRNNLQALLTRPPIPLQMDVLNESGSVGKQVGPRMSSEGNLGGHMEIGEADDLSNHNMHSRHLVRMSSLSPSSESPLRKPGFSQHNVAPSRGNLGTAGSPSPSRFAPTGHQGHPGNQPTISVSGTNYIASSPSPAASGGTSVFRDARLPSPWS